MSRTSRSAPTWENIAKQMKAANVSPNNSRQSRLNCIWHSFAKVSAMEYSRDQRGASSSAICSGSACPDAFSSGSSNR